MKRLIYLLPIMIFGGLVFFFVQGLNLRPSEVPSPLVGKMAPALNLAPLKSDKPGLQDSDLKGQVVLVNFFASWCVPCRAEHPLLMDIAEKKIVPVLGVNYKDKAEDALGWLKGLGDPYAKIGVDLDGRTAIDWGVYGVPESYLIDKEGRIRHKQIGPITPQAWEKTILPLIKELSK
jgi:cytochrome c biogenesis protein CcmG/thiol:disulfide interchange protein DsbE